MEPREYTGKTDATQGTAAGAPPDGAAAGGPLGRAPRSDAPSDAPRGGVPRVVLWAAVAVALVAGLVLYFRYEGAVSPLFGGGH